MTWVVGWAETSNELLLTLLMRREIPSSRAHAILWCFLFHYSLIPSCSLIKVLLLNHIHLLCYLNIILLLSFLLLLIFYERSILLYIFPNLICLAHQFRLLLQHFSTECTNRSRLQKHILAILVLFWRLRVEVELLSIWMAVFAFTCCSRLLNILGRVMPLCFSKLRLQLDILVRCKSWWRLWDVNVIRTLCWPSLLKVIDPYELLKV